MHLVEELWDPLAYVSLKGTYLQVPILDKDNLANHLVLLTELVVFNWVKEKWSGVLVIRCIDHQSLLLGMAVPLLHLPLLVVLEVCFDSCLFGVADDCEGVGLLLLSGIVELTNNVFFIVFEHDGR